MPIVKQYFKLLSYLLCLISLLPTEAGERPNIVFVLADDLGIGDVKCFGQERCRINTPAFDQLAEEGMRFTDAHSVAAVCVPSRVGIMTGRYPWRIQGAQENGPWGFLTPRFSSDQFHLGAMFKRSSYTTCYIGKWHLGTRMQTTDGKVQGPNNVDYTKPLEHGPVQLGFDHSFILPGSLDMFPYVFVKNGHFQGPVTKQRGWSAFNRVGPTADDFEDWNVLNTFCNEAETFIQKQADADPNKDPFFLYVALTSPHTPLSPHPKFKGKSEMGVYGDFVMETDDCLRRIMQALKVNGLSGNTLLIVSSDHGPATYAGFNRKATSGQVHDMEKKGHYPSGPYKGYKFTVYEGGSRVPFIARWPGVIPSNTTCSEMISLIDLMATFGDILDFSFRDSEALDSFSFLPLLMDPTSGPIRPHMIQQSTQPFIIRKGPFKLALTAGSGDRSGLDTAPTESESWQAAVDLLGHEPSRQERLAYPFVQLFHLEDDPKESTNLAKDHPEKVRELLQLLDRSILSGRTTTGPIMKNDRQVHPFLSQEE